MLYEQTFNAIDNILRNGTTEIGKSERTVKSITVSLQEKMILKRENGKRNGFWQIIPD